MTTASEAAPVKAASLDDFSDFLRPYAWIAGLSFASGFLGWFIVHPLA